MRIERTLDRGSVHRWADTCPGETPFRGTVYIAVEGGGVPDGELELIQRSLNGDLEAWGRS